LGLFVKEIYSTISAKKGRGVELAPKQVPRGSSCISSSGGPCMGKAQAGARPDFGL